MGKFIDWLYEKGILNTGFYLEAREVRNLEELTDFIRYQWCLFKIGFGYKIRVAKKQDGTILRVGMNVRLNERGLKNIHDFHGSGPILSLKKYPFGSPSGRIFVIAEVKGTRRCGNNKHIHIDWLRSQ